MNEYFSHDDVTYSDEEMCKDGHNLKDNRDYDYSSNEEESDTYSDNDSDAPMQVPYLVSPSPSRSQ